MTHYLFKQGDTTLLTTDFSVIREKATGKHTIHKFRSIHPLEIKNGQIGYHQSIAGRSWFVVVLPSEPPYSLITA